jgi:hypothetical protein
MNDTMVCPVIRYDGAFLLLGKGLSNLGLWESLGSEAVYGKLSEVCIAVSVSLMLVVSIMI